MWLYLFAVLSLLSLAHDRMGNACEHRFVAVRDRRTTQDGLFFFGEEMGVADCADCPEKNLTVFRSTSLLPGSRSRWRVFDARDCTHPTWDLQDDVRIAYEETVVGSVLRLLTGPALDGIQYHRYVLATAKCKRCGATWDMRNEFNEVWIDQQKVPRPTGVWQDVSTTAHLSERQRREQVQKCTHNIDVLEAKRRQLEAKQ